MEHPQGLRHSRWLEVTNATGEVIENVRLNFSLWGFGAGSWKVAAKLDPGEPMAWSLEDKTLRIASMFATYTRPGSSEVFRTPALQTPWNGYFRWLSIVINKGHAIVGAGRAQGMPAPAYAPGVFQSADLPAGSEALLAELPPPAPCVTAEATRFLELINFSGRAMDVESVAFATRADGPVEVAVNQSFRSGEYLEFNFGPEDGQVVGCKVNYRVDGERRSDYADFTVLGPKWFRYGSVMWTNPGEAEGAFEWFAMLSEKTLHENEPFGSNAAAGPRVVIEEDPNPQFPSAFCSVPTRLRNTESYPVRVRYSRTYRSEGPTNYCNSAPDTGFHEVDLGPGAATYLGCSRYRTPNMWCTEIREWSVVSVSRIAF